MTNPIDPSQIFPQEALIDFLRDLLEEVKANAPQLEPNADVPFLVRMILAGKEGLSIGIMHPSEVPATSEERQQMMFGMGHATAHQPQQVVPMVLGLIFMAWSARRTPEDVASGTGVRPSQDPNRQEVIVISGMTLDGRNASIMVPVDRDPEGRILLMPAIENFDAQPGADNLSPQFFAGFAQGTAEKMNAAMFAEHTKLSPDEVWDNETE